jgi:hypothetical protein
MRAALRTDGKVCATICSQSLRAQTRRAIKSRENDWKGKTDAHGLAFYVFVSRQRSLSESVSIGVHPWLNRLFWLGDNAGKKPRGTPGAQRATPQFDVACPLFGNNDARALIVCKEAGVTPFGDRRFAIRARRERTSRPGRAENGWTPAPGNRGSAIPSAGIAG